MNTEQHRIDQQKKFLYKDLGYQLRGCFFEIRRNYGPGQKESIYVNLIKEWLENHKVLFEKEKPIKIYSINSGKIIGTYKPDFLVDNKILLEIKSSRVTIKQDEKQLYFYLRNSPYEVGYLVNFSTPRLYIKRIIYTNDRKPFLQKNG
jgi:GxxExxY protein